MRLLYGKAVENKTSKYYSKLAASGIMIYKPMILNDKDGNPITDFVPDLRKGRNPSTGGAVPIIRARVEEQLDFPPVFIQTIL